MDEDTHPHHILAGRPRYRFQADVVRQLRKKGVTGRSEYRLTRFGKDFPFLNSNTVGHLFVLISDWHQDL